MPCKYLSLFFFKCVLKLHLQKLKLIKIRLKTARLKLLPKCQRLNVRKGKQISWFLLDTLLQLYSSCAAFRPPVGLDRWVSPSTRNSCAKPSRRGWLKHSFAWSPQCLGSVTNIRIWNNFIRTFLKNRKTFIQIYHFSQIFWTEGSCSTCKPYGKTAPDTNTSLQKKNLSSTVLNTHAD